MQELVWKVIWFLWTWTIFGLCGAQLQMPVNYLPKEYFLPDGTRDPRHLGPISSFFTGGGSPSSQSNSGGGGLISTTYHLNPRADLSANFNLNNNLNNHLNPNSNLNNNNRNDNNRNDNNLNLHNNNNNNNYGQNHHDIMNNQFGEKILSAPSSPSGKRSRRRLKLRRLPKSFRPPKEFIIYSLPEQSFWTTQGDDPLNSASETASDPNELDDNLDDTEDEENLVQNKNQTDKGTSPAVENIDEGAASSLSQKKLLLGQCMKQCIDALL